MTWGDLWGLGTTGILAPLAGPNQVAVPAGTAAAPGLTFETDSDSGFYRYLTNQIGVSCGGTRRGAFRTDGYQMANAAGPWMWNGAATTTTPTLIPNQADPDTGIGWGAGDQLALIAGAVCGQLIVEDGATIDSRFYDPTGAEYGYIRRDLDDVIVQGGTGGGLQLRAYAEAFGRVVFDPAESNLRDENNVSAYKWRDDGGQQQMAWFNAAFTPQMADQGVASVAHGVTDFATTNTALDALGTILNAIRDGLRAYGLES